MKVKIVKAKYPSLWYANKIGKVYSVKGKVDFKGMYKLVDVTGYASFIHKDDCRPVKKVKRSRLSANRPHNSRLSAIALIRQFCDERQDNDLSSYTLTELIKWLNSIA